MAAAGRTTATPEEVWAEVERLTPSDLLRLRKAAAFRVRLLRPFTRGRSDEDLLQEAIARTLSGQRSWQRAIAFAEHLKAVMRSISHSWLKTALREAEWPDVLRECEEGEVLSVVESSPSGNPGAERILSACEAVEEIRSLFEDDRVVLDIIDGLSAEMKGPEIREILDLSEEDFRAAIRRLRRRIGAEGR